MKRLFFFAPLVLGFAGCAGPAALKSPRAERLAFPVERPPVLSRASRIYDTPVRLDIADLRRRGRTVTLDLRLRDNSPHGPEWWTIGDDFSSNSDGNMSAVSLIDPVDGRRLHPLLDDADPDLWDETMTAGGTKTLTVRFPAPSGDTADVLVPHFGSFRDVPVR